MKNQTKDLGKQTTECNKKILDCNIPLIKNKVQRNNFDTKLNQWTMTKFRGIYLINSDNMQSRESQMQIVNKHSHLCRLLQKQLHLKYDIQHILSHLSLQYFKTLIKYVVQKKLDWIFKGQNNSEADATIHKQFEVQLSYQLKTFYKHFQYKVSRLHNHKNVQKTSELKAGKSPRNFQMQTKVRKNNSDFYFQLFIMLSVSLAASFFECCFSQIQIQNVFQSEIYVIVTHAFFDLQVSPSVFEVMKRKFYHKQPQRNFKSLNTNFIKTISSNKHKENQIKSGHNQNSNPNLNSRIKNFTQDSCKQFKQPIIKIHSEQNHNERTATTQTIKTIKTVNIMGSRVGFSAKSINRMQVKKQSLLKPASSIDNNLETQGLSQLQSKLGTFGKKHYNFSRFQSFLQGTKQLNLSPIIQDTLSQDYLPPEEQYQFYSTVKNSLQVASLPPIIKKKNDIKDYQRENDISNLKQIRKQVQSLDMNSKKNHIKTNGLSLAMNTFISTSCGFAKRKRNKKNMKVVLNFLEKQSKEGQKNSKKQQTQSQSIGQCQKQVFQLRILPLRSANLKLKPQKSSNLYRFTESLQKDVPKSPQFQPQKVSLKAYTSLTSNLSFQSKRTIDHIQKISAKNFERSKSKNKQNNFLQTKKKSATQWEQFIKSLKSQNKQEIMTLGSTNFKMQKKRSLQRQSHAQIRQRDLNSSLSTPLQTRTFIAKSIKRIEQNTGSDQNQNEDFQDKNQKERLHRDSICAQLSNKLQLYELGARDAVDPEQISDTNRNQGNKFSKYSSLQGQVNVNKDISMSYKSQYKSFELKKKLQNFQKVCKKREQRANYSLFNVQNYKTPFKVDYTEDAANYAQELVQNC